MSEPDPLDNLLREWKAPEPAAELDQAVVAAYRSAVRTAPPPVPFWQRFWSMRISVPVPAVLAVAVAILGVLVWLRPAAPPASPNSADAVTQLSATGFQPLPNGETHVITALEVHK